VAYLDMDDAGLAKADYGRKGVDVTLSPAVTTSRAMRDNERCYSLARGAEMHEIARCASKFGAAGHRALRLQFDGLVSLCPLIGLFQGGIVPRYAIIVRRADRSGRPHWHRADGHVIRRRWRRDVRRSLRPHRFLPGGIPQRSDWNLINAVKDVSAALPTDWRPRSRGQR
jgi:hypothetical protein